MTELDRTWAESQIEAMAEGSLSAEAERRMLAAIEPRCCWDVMRAIRNYVGGRAGRRARAEHGKTANKT